MIKENAHGAAVRRAAGPRVGAVRPRRTWRPARESR